MTGISITEWQERINSIIVLLDEQFDVCDDDDNQRQKQGQKQYCSPHGLPEPRPTEILLLLRETGSSFTKDE